MKLSNICKERQIPIIDAATPLIVPSFSSRGFPELKNIYAQTKEYISDVSLISAYDKYYELQDVDIYASDILFIDSGGYETQSIKLTATSDDVYAYRNSTSLRPWSRKLHKAVLDNLQDLSQLVIISYDDWNNYQSTLSQIETAKSLFENYPNFASNFLYKPEASESQFISLDSLLEHAHHLSSFSMLGITEKELGSSLLERCRNLLKIRSHLQEQSMETPIHILGCLDPALIISYFLCGADIFDGLAWLRYAFVDGLTMYESTAAIMQSHWHYSESDLNQLYSIKNLQNLNHLSQLMKKVCETKNINELYTWGKAMPQVINLVKEAGLEIEEY